MKYFYIKAFASRRIQAGEKLLLLEDFEDSYDIEDAPEGMIIFIADREHHFKGQAVIGRQNKGFAWVFSLNHEDLWSKELFRLYLEEAIEHRQLLFNDPTTTGFRLFNGEGDGIGGLSIDWYDHFIQINWYSRGAYKYKDWWIENLLESTINVEGIYETKRFDLDSTEEAICHVTGKKASQPIIIKERERNYAVYLGEDWMTGIFFDQREVRQFVQEQAQGMSVLNLFSYTGAFSIAAGLGGASKTTSVDVANRSFDLTKENLSINDLKTNNDWNEIRIMDVFDYIDYAKRTSKDFDMVICDPPSFARTKKYVFSAITDYLNLAIDLFRITKPGGLCILSTNHSNYTKEKFIEDMNEAGRLSGKKVQLIQSFGLPDDYPTSEDPSSAYLKVLVYYCAE
ncbi:class I SAM-dependent rRNA methyltransferase [Facklamia miroungae]|uniref:23S rRNA (Cytosine1962-C5)-methyltransferase n=1 Tax=Facklamia miroungae TaxID=120956 RepID=A0A1G7TI04_9LACT|nr:class I SAM-dependent rRNA methyltransferase [Facklamia miroungae]NKZ29851.1 class I SAM-dependent rRNA methyltransferase [Facklamia miroungae]SDG34170.1 23S rRNA (cytosine1962-C5)-methyltransferase [Facklamia miroungae]